MIEGGLEESSLRYLRFYECAIGRCGDGWMGLG